MFVGLAPKAPPAPTVTGYVPGLIAVVPYFKHPAPPPPAPPPPPPPTTRYSIVALEEVTEKDPGEVNV